MNHVVVSIYVPLVSFQSRQKSFAVVGTFLQQISRPMDDLSVFLLQWVGLGIDDGKTQ